MNKEEKDRSERNGAGNADQRGRPLKPEEKHPDPGINQGTPQGQDTGTQLLGKSQETGSGNEATGSPLNKGSQYGTEGNAVRSGTGLNTKRKTKTNRL
jgi:hypothetical protein